MHMSLATIYGCVGRSLDCTSTQAGTLYGKDLALQWECPYREKVFKTGVVLEPRLSMFGSKPSD